MPNSQQHRLTNINRPGNAVANPTSYMHLDYSNPIASRMNFRSVVRSSATGMSTGTPNANRFVIRNLDADKRRMFEEARGQQQRYEASLREKERIERNSRIPKLTNEAPIVFIVKGHSGYSPDDIVAVDSAGRQHVAPPSTSGTSGNWKVQYSPSLDVDTVGVYEATYTFTDPNPENGKEAATTRTVRVIDRPTIALKSAGSTVNITKGDRWALSVADEYVVADDASLHSIAKRVVRVKATPPHPRYSTSAGNSNATFDEVNVYVVSYELDYEKGARLLHGVTLPIYATKRKLMVLRPTTTSIVQDIPVVYTKVESGMQSMFPTPDDDDDDDDGHDHDHENESGASVNAHVNYQDTTSVVTYDDSYYDALLNQLAPEPPPESSSSSSYIDVDHEGHGDGSLSSSGTIYNRSVVAIDSRGARHTSPSSSQGNWTITETPSLDTFTQGKYVRRYEYKDPYSGDVVHTLRTIHIVNDPTMTLNGPTSLTMVVGNVWVDTKTTIVNQILGSTYTVTGAPPTDGSNRLTAAGNYTVQYVLGYSNMVGNATAEIRVTRQVEVTPQAMPTAIPVLHVDPITTYHVHGKSYVDLHGVVCKDSDGAVVPTLSPRIDSTTAKGAHDVVYTATNLRGSTRVTRRVLVVDQPTLVLRGAASATYYVGEPFVDHGTIVDTKGVHATPVITVAGAPQIDVQRRLTTTGTYTVKYTMAFVDAYSMVTPQAVSRTVVVKAAKPTLSVVPTVVYWLKGTAYNDATVGGVSATNAASSPTKSGAVTHTTPGAYTLTYTVQNADGVTATATRRVEIISSPTLALKGGATLSLNTGVVWSDPGYNATDTRGAATRSVTVTGVPPVDLLGRLSTAGAYTLTYTLTCTNTPSAQVAPIVRTRFVNVVAPANPPVITVSPTRVYHRLHDVYSDTGVAAKSHAGAVLAYTTTITRVSDSAVRSASDLRSGPVGEYLFTYSVTDNGITVTERRWVDVYIDVLDSRNHTSKTRSGITESNHPTVPGLKVFTFAGRKHDEWAELKNSPDVNALGLNAFTYSAWVRVHAGPTTGRITVLKLKCISVYLEIRAETADYFDGTLSTRLRASLYGIVGGENYYKTFQKVRYSIPYPHVMLDSKRREWSTMHDCPELGTWAWVGLQYDGRRHMILSLNGARFEHAVGVHEAFDTSTSANVFHSGGFPTTNPSQPYSKMDVCDARFYARMLHMHEIQDEYERFVRANLKTELDAYPTHLDNFEAYVQKNTPTSSDHAVLLNALKAFRRNSYVALQVKDGVNLKKALSIIQKYEAKHGPLFVGLDTRHWLDKIGTLYQPSRGRYGFAPYLHSTGQGSELNSHRLARAMLFFQQIVWDSGIQPNSPYKHYFVSSEYQISFASRSRSDVLQKCVEDASWNTATHLKGQFTNVTSPKSTMTITLKARNRNVKHIPGDYFMVPMPRCTGMWVDRGTISEVTLPETLIGTGCQLCVGAHRNDPSLVEGGHGGGVHSRLDRVVTHFLVDRSTVRVYNPLGGNIYLLCPYGVDIGMVKLSATNVVPSRHYRIVNDDITGYSHETTQSEWDKAKGVAAGGPPTVDIETDHALVHLPSQWLDDLVSKYGWLSSISGLTTVFQRIQNLAHQYESVCKSVAVFRGIDVSTKGKIDHPMLYTSVDMVMRTSAGGVGWPMVNGPLIRDDQPNYYTSNWCVDNGTMWHELGHMYCNRALAFSNEGESSNEVMNIYILNQTCGYDVDSAYMLRGYGNACLSLDDGVVDWMKEDMFTNGNYMSYKYAGYQGRSWHKYIDIVALVGWDGFLAYQRSEGVLFDKHAAMSPPTPVDTTDKQRVFRMSRALGMDMAPLLEFWGITDKVPANQAQFRTDVRALIDPMLGTKPSEFSAYGPSHARHDCKVHRCRGVRTLLLYFKSLIPRTNREAVDYVLRSWKRCKEGATAESISSTTRAGDKYLGWWIKYFNEDKKTWDSAKIAAIEKRIDDILRDHGLTTEPPAEPGCVACANNRPNYSPSSVLEAPFAVMPTKYRSYAFADRMVEYRVTEDTGGFVLTGAKDHNGPLSGRGRLPTLNLRLHTRVMFHVNSTSPFYIKRSNGMVPPSHVWVKRQGVTTGTLVFLISENITFYYGDRSKSSVWYGEINIIY